MPSRRIRQLARGAVAEELDILAISDVRSQPIEDLLAFTERLRDRPDLIVYAGDDVARFGNPTGSNYFEKLARRSRYGLVAVSGNDDGAEAWRLIQGRRVHEVHRNPVLLGDILIVGLEGAPRRPGLLAKGSPLYAESEIAKHLSSVIDLVPQVPVVIVAHCPPYKVLDRARRFGDSHIGSRALRNLIQREPRIRLVICGHCHRQGGEAKQLGGAVVINAASHDGPEDFIRVARYHWSRRSIQVSGPPPVDFSFAYPWGELMGVPGMYHSDYPALWKVGITKLAQLAETSAEDVSNIVGRRPAAVRRFPLLARATLTSTPIPISPLHAPPEPRVYFDIETDPYGGNKLCWLVGVLDQVTGRFYQLLARTPAHERSMLAKFAKLCGTLENRSFVSYSGSNFDHRNAILRMRAHGIPVPKPLMHAMDLLYPVQFALAVPEGTYALKSVAASLGYRYRHTDLDGWTVAHEYLRLAEARRPIPRKFLEYNEDDVRSLAHVVAKVETICGYGGPPLPRKHKLSGAARRRLGKS